MVEWIAHYLALGFDELLIYDNGSTDETFAVLECLSLSEPRIRLSAWPDVAGQIPQSTAYNHAAARAQSQWMAFFDADELLVLKEHACIHDFLVRYPAEAGAVAINWKLFGSSGQEKYVDELQSIRFRRCAQDHPATKDRFIKSIVRVESIKRAAAHTAVLKPGFRYFDDQAQPVDIIESCKTVVPSHRVAQLNHYVVRSRQEFLEKRARGNVARTRSAPDKFGRDETFWRTHDTNHRQDWAIDPWVGRAAPIRRRLFDHLFEHGVSSGRSF
jgi:glycosyltransferase involved in cell wall biosynthesis